MKILLLDIDGVLLESMGYHQALQETVRLMALRLGFSGTMSRDEIAAFEAGGITSEWDEAAIVTAYLLERAWLDDPSLTLPEDLVGIPSAASLQPWPGVSALAADLSTAAMVPLHPLERAARYFFRKPSRTPQQEETLHTLILGARLAEASLTHRTFQEFVLGSEEYERAYGLTAEHHCESYLLQYDRSNLTAAQSAQIRERLSQPGHAAAIITSRPSIPPAGVFSTPEAELACRLVGLEIIPILGWGGLCWLGLQTHIDPQSFLKPSPVHALAGLRMALGASQETALKEAADLVENGLAGPDWQQLAGAEVSVFEDTPGGIRSLQAAEALLDRAGIPIIAHNYGIARQEIKVKSLLSVGAQVYPTLAEALELDP